MKVIFKNTSLEFYTYMFEHKDVEAEFSRARKVPLAVNFKKGCSYKIVRKTVNTSLINFYRDINEQSILFTFNGSETEKTFTPEFDIPFIYAHVYEDCDNVLFTIIGHSFLNTEESFVQSLEDIQTSTTPKDMLTSISLEENTYYKLILEGDATLTLLDSGGKVILGNMTNEVHGFYFGKAVTCSKATCFDNCNSLKIYKITSSNV